MNWISFLSNAVIPCMILVILLYAKKKKTPLFATYAEGAEEGLTMAVQLLPTFIGLFMAVACMRASGLLEFITGLLTPFSKMLHFPSSLIPIAITKFISSSAATSLVLDLFASVGPDAVESQIVAVMIGSTETVLYTMSVYFMAVNIQKTRWTLQGAVIATVAGIIASILIVTLL